MDENVVFCRLLYREIMVDVRKLTTVETRKAAWVYNHGRGSWEFQISPCKQFPKGFYWYGSAYCAWEAKYNGWSKAFAKELNEAARSDEL